MVFKGTIVSLKPNKIEGIQVVDRYKTFFLDQNTGNEKDELKENNPFSEANVNLDVNQSQIPFDNYNQRQQNQFYPNPNYQNNYNQYYYQNNPNNQNTLTKENIGFINGEVEVQDYK